ncbi:MAG: isocitrate/isopropylmalate dehydrogenase family protein [Chloroflexi bacterium]|nr:isocitrate/isopropylmalate dehydrogenase family protein [Chloroflexota bacterium]
MPYTVTLIPGDGIGPEITEATRRVIEATGVPIDWDVQQAGEAVMAEFGTPLPDHVLDSIRRNRVALKGPITTPVGTGFRSVNVALRQALDLYVNLRPARSFVGAPSRFEFVDLIVVRENTEDLYAGIEFQVGTPEMAQMRHLVAELSGKRIREDAALSLKPISEFGTRRVAQFAFDYARRNGRRKVTIVHKANIMKYTDGLFLDVAGQVARDYPDVEANNAIVDNMSMQLVQKPELYDVLLCPNLYGDILSDLAAGLVGGLGLAPGANIGERGAVFEPVHGSVPKYAGQNRANPIAMMLSGAMMLRYLGEREAGERLEAAIADTISEGTCLTADMTRHRGQPAAVGTSQVADCIAEKLTKR